MNLPQIYIYIYFKWYHKTSTIIYTFLKQKKIHLEYRLGAFLFSMCPLLKPPSIIFFFFSHHMIHQ